MRRALGKSNLRVVGIDDGPFHRGSRTASVVAVVVSGPAYVEAVLRTTVRVDGDDATDRISEMLLRSNHLDGVRAVLLDGIAVGGFNLVDLDRLSRAVSRPVVSLTRRPPDFDAMRAALRKYFPAQFARRWRIVRARPLFRVPTLGAPLWAAAAGCRRTDALSVLRRTAVRGYWPEPLRLARLVARSLAPPVTGRTTSTGV